MCMKNVTVSIENFCHKLMYLVINDVRGRFICDKVPSTQKNKTECFTAEYYPNSHTASTS